MDFREDMRRSLRQAQDAGMLRRLREAQSACSARIRLEGREVVSLASNDYLGLAADERVKSAAIEAIGRWGVGAGASRLVSGNTSLHQRLETELAAFKGAEAALVTPTGWMANHAAIHALAGKGDLVLCDKLSHASILDAALSSGAAVRTFAHRDVDRLRDLLGRHRAAQRRCLIVTDSLFSMDGDLAPLVELCDVKDRFEAAILVDEAHATGVLGERGAGAAEMLGVEGRIDVTVGTLSKALGALGGFVAGPRPLIDTIVNSGRAFIFTTALPPAICAAALEALKIVRDEPQRRRRLLELARALSGRLNEAGLATHADGGAGRRACPGAPGLHAGSDRRACNLLHAESGAAPPGFVSQIIPILVGEAGDAVRLSERLLEEGFFAPAIRPPSVPRGASRLRVSLRCDHDEADLTRFADVLARIADCGLRIAD
jgi:8-amino-7-oxononanoate synthase